MSDKKTFILILLTLVGLLLSMYLAYLYSLPVPVICVGGDHNSCEVVRNSSESYFLGIRLPFWGIAYFICFLFLEMLYLAKTFSGKLLLSLMGFMLISGLLFETYMTFVQFFVLRSVCAWCLGIELVIVIMNVWFFYNLKKPGV